MGKLNYDTALQAAFRIALANDVQIRIQRKRIKALMQIRTPQKLQGFLEFAESLIFSGSFTGSDTRLNIVMEVLSPSQQREFKAFLDNHTDPKTVPNKEVLRL